MSGLIGWEGAEPPQPDSRFATRLACRVAAAVRRPGARRGPAARRFGFGANTLDFELRCWSDSFDDWVEIRSQLALDLHRQLGDAGIETSSPQRVVQVTEEMATPVKR